MRASKLLKHLIENMVLSIVVVVMIVWDIKMHKTQLCTPGIFILAEEIKHILK